MAEERKIEYKLSAVVDQFTAGLRQAMGGFDKFSESLLNGKNLMFVAGTAAVTLGAALVAVAKKTAQTGDDLMKMSDQTGIAVEKLSLLRFAAEQSDTNLESLSIGLKGLGNKMLDVVQGSTETVRIFEALGVSVTRADGSLRPMEDVLLQVSDVFKALPNGAQKSALAVELFGKSGLELIPFLNEGSEGIARLTDRARELGLEMSTETATAASRFNDQLNELKFSAQGLSEQIGARLIPALVSFIDNLREVDKIAQKSGGWFVMLSNPGLALAIEEQEQAAAKFVETQRAALTTLARLTDAEKAAIATALDGLKIDEAKITSLLTREEREKAAAKAVKDREKAEKEAAAQSREQIELATTAIERNLGVKAAFAQFDEEYFRNYAALLRLQGQTNEEVQIAIAQKSREVAHAKQSADRDYASYHEEALRDLLASEDQTAQERLKIAIALGNKLGLMQGNLTKEIIGKKEEEAELTAIYESWKQTAARSVGEAIKSIWNDTTTTFRDAWKNALNAFVDVLMQMLIQYKTVSIAIQIETAAMTAGLTLFLSLLASMIGRGKGKNKVDIAREELQRQLEAFLDQIAMALDRFLDDTSTVLQTLQRRFGQIAGNIATLYDRMSRVSEAAAIVAGGDQSLGAVAKYYSSLSALQNFIVEAGDELFQGIIEKYQLERELLNGVVDIIRGQSDFVADLTENITNVQRALLTPEEMFQALLGDVASLESLVSSTTGQVQIDALGDLQAAYNELFGLAQDLFAEDPAALQAWQAFVVAGLEGIRETGVSAYDQLIDIGLAQLGLTKDGLLASYAQTDLQAAISDHLAALAAATAESLDLLGKIAAATPDQLAGLAMELARQLSILGFEDLPAFAHGGIVTRPMTAVVGEVPEAIIPLSQLNAGGVMAVTVDFRGAFPNVRSLSDIGIPEAETLLKTIFMRAAENVGRAGYQWPMRLAVTRGGR